ncbi:hypothetical protein [Nesterenkonia xinjiangensis]|uniref:Uncharacterized protein n=1 Tax=Nesterenkonia xinjiangensis TaxID=225327 RepID=A0A7Z0GKL7_9MICC|nr:hypothetical protein [Nesterenkonia xinjiangensis]NYJ76846.1 hypothetical protein [Nesterenkonia xinjiangensis]
MRPAAEPAPLHRVFILSWIMARAFTRHRPGAIMAYPLSLLIVGFSALRRQLYESSDGHGMVVFGRFRLLHEIIAGVLLALLFMAALVLVVGNDGPMGIGLAALLWLPFIVGLWQMSAGSLSATPTGPETPVGERWQVAALAQRPGTSMSALLLTRNLMGTLPRGAVAVAAADDDDLLAACERFGFTRGKGRRVFRVVT